VIFGIKHLAPNFKMLKLNLLIFFIINNITIFGKAKNNYDQPIGSEGFTDDTIFDVSDFSTSTNPTDTEVQDGQNKDIDLKLASVPETVSASEPKLGPGSNADEPLEETDNPDIETVELDHDSPNDNSIDMIGDKNATNVERNDHRRVNVDLPEDENIDLDAFKDSDVNIKENQSVNFNFTIDDYSNDTSFNETAYNGTSSNETSPGDENITESPPTTEMPKNILDSREFETHLSQVTSLDCPVDAICSDLPAPCLNCTFDYACRYGEKVKFACLPLVDCRGDQNIVKEMTCQFCYQTQYGSEHYCSLRNGPEKKSCLPKPTASTRTRKGSRFQTNCTVHPHVFCLGRRTFPKMIPCNWTSGHRWTTAILLSIFLGGFGADRFYLGRWKEGIGKLFSFGGLGLWTVIDVILIAIGYIGPEDGSLYIY